MLESLWNEFFYLVFHYSDIPGLFIYMKTLKSEYFFK